MFCRIFWVTTYISTNVMYCTIFRSFWVKESQIFCIFSYIIIIFRISIVTVLILTRYLFLLLLVKLSIMFFHTLSVWALWCPFLHYNVLCMLSNLHRGLFPHSFMAKITLNVHDNVVPYLF